ncbi:hypothetical protein [Sphingobium fuliginis]|uniref:Uncharacterized protein n=1 Tax=Sphingobium fuliginis ATCC 27551 TaxID=1208342 RepID=A0A5B8CFS7_SPHSA|nr:hypothetical protein [Sphingobium fuliginis]QDC38418.1 hypothetical protein FIL70_15410 [Sphingobium fuliginis ATCC 27551]
MTRIIERQKFIRYWMEQTGEAEIDMRAVAEFAIKMGWKPPPPVDPVDALAKTFKDAARQDIRKDRKTGRPYRGYHAFPKAAADGQMTFSYVDIDDPKTKPEHFQKACVLRREQMVDDGVQLTFDMDHWNSLRPAEQHVDLPMDLQPDIEWRRAARDDTDEAA